MQVRAEHLDSPLGIGEREPRLSWVLPVGSGEQRAYEVEVDGIRVRVEGDAHVLVPWPGKALGSGERREVRVRVETEAGLGEWSDPLAVEAGLLEPDDWSAAWVSTGDRPVRPATDRRTGSAARSRSTSPSSARACTRPRTGSTSSSSTDDASGRTS